MRSLPLLVALAFANCVRSSGSPSEPLAEDTSIVFPSFFERAAIGVGEQGTPYELEGVTLRAITVAANDFIPPDSKERPCWDRQEAYRYRVIRQGDIIFVRIFTDPTHCRRGFLMLDAGAQYAISTDGRILRRVFDGEPEGPSGIPLPDAGGQRLSGEPVPSSSVGTLSGEPSLQFLPKRRDGGTAPALPDAQRPLPSPLDGGSSSALEGGSSAAPDGGLPAALDAGLK
ncbi:hypothetical protein [Vitiosangium sp. GDMCC 1.1324]|uniref:hypothetical protein n=1 Tax=Vitiosangium sp. (strain GDMCC 1.1324) TaxID=2138576 RepID=UPI000D3854B4|nr:hypothetical protein [Vitiosangium sp. GDMCC 1.1324]PTL76571.1 hypothetical protein DAT35_49045 [Vitiosangium sp. GDMCC 1.1324]